VAGHARLVGGVVLRRREGDLRTPCMIGWPGHVPAGRSSNEIMHVTDCFATLLRAEGVSAPPDRVIDGIDRLERLTGHQDASAREGFMFWMGREMYGAKWYDRKAVLVIQKYLTDSALRLAAPHLINLIADPQGT
jgi:arylsulfatase A-like enzyme